MRYFYKIQYLSLSLPAAAMHKAINLRFLDKKLLR